MSNKREPIYQYKKSFLLFWHTVLALALTFFTYALNVEYIRKKEFNGSIISIFILLLYFLLLRHTAKLFNQQKIGLAYFLTITGFLVASFVQIVACANILPFNMH